MFRHEKSLETLHDMIVDLRQSIIRIFEIQPITSDNAILLLSEALKYDVKSLEDKCMEFIELHATDVIYRYPHDIVFQSIDYKTLFRIVKSEKLEIEEKYLCYGVEWWAHKECLKQGKEVNGKNKRHVLKDVFSFLRLPLLNKEELKNYGYEDYLTHKELEAMHKFYATGEKPSYYPESHFHKRG